ncbi:carboxymuconolactone decarboxylase family protein, partial [Bosea vaviloviae]
PVEVQVVMMTSNYHNRCHYCMAGHSMIMTMLKAPQDVIAALREGKPVADTKLEALRVFTRKLLEEQGHVGDEALNTFLAAGYSKAQVLDVLICLSTKLLSNFTNALAQTEVDAPMKAMAWTPPSV